MPRLWVRHSFVFRSLARGVYNRLNHDPRRISWTGFGIIKAARRTCRSGWLISFSANGPAPVACRRGLSEGADGCGRSSGSEWPPLSRNRPFPFLHRREGDPHARPAEPIRPGEGREPGSSGNIHDLGRSELVNGLVQCVDVEVCLHSTIVLGPMADKVPVSFSSKISRLQIVAYMRVRNSGSELTPPKPVGYEQ
ncbi:hypothetical protein SAMN04487991_2598 [Celeribacter neptunius]|uniref:Uncharacterized protein n=1 Tax=Celeribacter neptunius TaxID=588602 RepID=A0A1I3SVG8_9RHOB|nr:hypothetical protein SAMN04487991_2598 [Celeribacter neptunius]